MDAVVLGILETQSLHTRVQGKQNFLLAAPLFKVPETARVRADVSLRRRAPPVWFTRPSKTFPRPSAALGSALPPRGSTHPAVFEFEGTRHDRRL
jgi:hypothetical protein